MALSVFPVPSASTSLETKVINVASPNTGYVVTSAFPAAVYTITCVSSTVATLTFEDDAGALGSVSTSSGTVQITLAREAKKCLVYTNTGTNINVTITPGGRSVTPVTTGTPTLYTTSQSITSLGAAYAVIVGGGGGGGSRTYYGGSGGGGAGGVSAGYVALNGDAYISIGGGGGGAQDVGSGFGGGGGGGGGNTTLSGTGFTTLIAYGGGGGGRGYSPYGGGGGSGNAANGENGSSGEGGGGGSAYYNSGTFTWVKSGTLGLGGAGGSQGQSPTEGYGGGGGGANGSTGGNGAPGALWLLEI